MAEPTPKRYPRYSRTFAHIGRAKRAATRTRAAQRKEDARERTV